MLPNAFAVAVSRVSIASSQGIWAFPAALARGTAAMRHTEQCQRRFEGYNEGVPRTDYPNNWGYYCQPQKPVEQPQCNRKLNYTGVQLMDE